MKAVQSLFLALAFLSPTLLLGHGTVTSPISRVYSIYLEGPDSPQSPSATAAIAHAGSSQYYTWNQVSKNVPTYASITDSYASVIPDGKLASGDSGSGLDFGGLDLVSPDWDWPATPVSAGTLPVTWSATAPHDPSFFKVWITKDTFDPKSPLAWSELEYLGRWELGNGVTKSGNDYLFDVELPDRTGRHVLYIAWQRVDPVGEVFFSTSDILFGDDPTSPSLPIASIANATFGEDVGNASITVTLSKPVPIGSVATLDYATGDASAIAGEDYTSRSGTLTFEPGVLSATFDVPIIDDATVETDEAFTVTLSNPIGITLGNSTALITITDNDGGDSSPGGVTFEIRDDWGTGYGMWVDILNPGPDSWTNPTVTFDLGQPVSYFGGGTRTDNANGHHTVTTSVTVPPGGTLRFDLVVQPVLSTDPRGPTNIRVNGQAFEPGTATPRVRVDDVSFPEGDTPGITIAIPVTLSSPATEKLHVAYTLLHPFEGNTTGTLVFEIGSTESAIPYTYDGDTIPEPDVILDVLLSGVPGQTQPVFAYPDGQTATVTLLDDDRAISMTATGGVVIEPDSGTVDLPFRIFLARPVKPGETVSVDYEAHGHGATLGRDFVETKGTLVFAEGEDSAIVNVPVLGDLEDETLEIVMLHFSSPVGLFLKTMHAVGQIVDNQFDRSRLGNRRVIAYLDATSGTLNLPPADRVTHIMYGFAFLNADGSLDIAGPGFAAVNALKTTNPDLKVALSIGGWTWSGNFPAVAASPTLRQAFAEACRAAIVANQLDGIDLDWEWPGVPGGPGTTPTPQDGANFTLLVAALRAELDDLEATDGLDKHYEISAFTPAGPDGIAQLELEALEPYFDFLNVQGYDLHGTWDSVTGHNAGLHDNSADPGDDRLNIEAIMNQYLAGGFPAEKLLVGAPFYGRTFTGVGSTALGAFQPHSGSGSMPLYRELAARIAVLPRQWDPYAKVPFLYDERTGEWISYDDPQSMFEKGQYVVDGGFGGIFYWRSGGDADSHELLMAISDTLAVPIAPDISTIALSLAPASVGDGLGGSFLTRPEYTYQVESSTDLKLWHRYGESIAGDGTLKTFHFTPVPDEPRRFFRVLVY